MLCKALVVSWLRAFFCFNTWTLLQVGVCVAFYVMLKISSIILGGALARMEFYEGRVMHTLMNTDDSDLYLQWEQTAPYMNTRERCQDASGFDALMVVHSANWHFARRQEYRDTYGNPDFTSPFKLKLVFFLAMSMDPVLMSRIGRENAKHGDTVVLSHQDSYHNMTTKAIGAFRWVSTNCHGLKVLLKADDDVLFDVHRFFDEFWPPPAHHRHAIYCHVWIFAEVEREGKWRMSKAEYRAEKYPEYCSGFFVVISPDVIFSMYQTARSLRTLWIDDVFLYGVVRREDGYIQMVHEDRMAHKSEIYQHCWEKYNYRCKYWATVMDEQQPFLPQVLSLKAQRLQYMLGQERLTNRSQSRRRKKFRKRIE